MAREYVKAQPVRIIIIFPMGKDPFGNGSISSNTNSKHW